MKKNPRFWVIIKMQQAVIAYGCHVFPKKDEVFMFQKGDLVTYGCKGVCVIKDVTTLNMAGIPKDRLYYEMQLLHDAGSKIFTPVEHEASRSVMRPVLSGEEAERLLGRLESLKAEWIPDDRAREAYYREAINHSDAEGMLAIIRSLHLRRKERMAQGRKLTAMDSKYLRMAEDNLYTEISLALQIPLNEAAQQIGSQIARLDETIKTV